MFDDVIRKLKRLERGVRVSIPMPLDEEGYLDRRCPSEGCGADFKVMFSDSETKVREDCVFCPVCGHQAHSSEWNTSDQQRYIKQFARSYIAKEVGQAFKEGVSSFNRRQPRGGFLQMSMSYKPGTPIIVIPVSVADLMRQKFTCEQCGLRYAAVGAAFFCPACGHNSADSAFDQALATVRKVMDNRDTIREAIAQAQDADTAQNAVRQMMEDSVCRLVASFQRLAEAIFNRLPAAANVKQRKNVFQNLADSSALWRAVGCKGYEDFLSASEMVDITCLFQQRHLLAHRDAIVDQDYIDKSGDGTYAVGQRLVVNEAAVLRLAALDEILAAGIRSEVRQATLKPLAP